MGEISVKTGNNARNGGKNSLNRLIRCVCGKKIGPDPRNFNQRVSLGRNDLLIRTFPHSFMNNSASYAHQKMIEEHKKMLSGSDANSKTSSSSFNELNAGEKAALVHEQVNNAGAEAHQTQARKLRGLYSTR
ncbi:hypothetical protein [Klebsiella pneumoniae]|uniref:hypothetical protein n=1 Tax=Klebsiella pneumoniae TaxID=573 RepID=UPI0024069860|nr:hypothetical protein [Klebsiella pneumoniae]MDG0327144.1 hypothetical protein [Klebsiella pneumoniae]